MSKQNVWRMIGRLSFVASGAMYVIGSNNGHMTELKDLFFVPLPLGIVAFMMAGKDPKEAAPEPAPAAPEPAAPEPAASEESASDASADEPSSE